MTVVRKNSDLIYNRNWLSYQLMKMYSLVGKIYFAGETEGQRQAHKFNTEKLNTRKHGYAAEAHFLSLVVMVQFFIGAAVAILSGTIIISIMLITGEDFIPGMYIFYISSIPGALMFVHTWKSLNLEIIKARKIPYREKNGYFTEVRNSDLIPSVVILIIVIIGTLVTYL